MPTTEHLQISLRFALWLILRLTKGVKYSGLSGNRVMPSQSVVVLLSGGLDSTVSLASMVADPSVSVLRCVAFDYGQRPWAREHQAVKAICAYYGLPLQIITLDWLKHLVPVGYTSEFRGVAKDLHDVWVPNRNGVLLNIGASIAEGLGADAVVFGANLDEAEAGFPDNGEEFWFQLNQALRRSTLKGVRVWAPVGDLRKVDIVRRAQRLEAPLSLIWSCYSDGEVHCGQCASCLHLQRGLHQAGYHPLPLVFADPVEWA
jgi:7-cyano-7-deazaguanine synthase